jgi:hypothetical protein
VSELAIRAAASFHCSFPKLDLRDSKPKILSSNYLPVETRNRMASISGKFQEGSVDSATLLDMYVP